MSTSVEGSGRLRSALRHVVASRADLEASEERRQAARTGCKAVRDVPDRRRAEVAGVLRSVTLRSRDNVPALEAELYDGTGSVRVLWLGRRAIGGVEPGRRIRLEGLVASYEGVPTMFNPRYELLSRTHG